jgi:processive 1,2-diacylglycerol beta-glucosyltransferase
MNRILILSAGYGEGHNTAAKALAAALVENGHDVQVRDLFLEAYGGKQELSRNLYLQCIESTPWLWALTYHALDRLPLMRNVIAPLLRRMQELLGRVLRDWKPTSVVSVYPGYNYLLDRLFPRGTAPFKRHTLVTDSLTINSIWYKAGSDTWLVPNEDTARVLRRAGLPVEKIHVTGFPVQAVFADRRPDRVAPGKGEPLRVLYMVNNNRRHAAATVRRLLAVDGVKLTVVGARDTQFASQLEGIAREMNRPLEVHGWTNRMPDLVMRHHVLISKAGGATTQEAIAAGTPLLFTKIVPGQELGNARLIEAHNCGAITVTPDAVLEQIHNLLRDDCALWLKWHRSILALSRPEAARDAARFVLNFERVPVHG